METTDVISEEIDLKAIIGEIEEYLDEQEEMGNKFEEYSCSIFLPAYEKQW